MALCLNISNNFLLHKSLGRIGGKKKETLCFTCVVEFMSTMKKIDQMGIKHICDVFPHVGWFSLFYEESIFVFLKVLKIHLLILINLFQPLGNQLTHKVSFSKLLS
jgi:hypothetical protein